MHKFVISVLILLGVSGGAPQKAEAGVFATEVTQLLNHAQLVLMYIREGLQLENELAMYANMLRNTKNLSPQTFGQIAGDISALAQIVQGGQALAYSLGNLDHGVREVDRQRSPQPDVRSGQAWIDFDHIVATSIGGSAQH